MERLMKQTRMKISGAREENKEESSSIRDGKIKPQKTQSFRGEKKKSLQGWMRKRFSRSMSWDYDFRGEDYQAAVAAAAFAVQSHEESTTMDQEKIPDYTTIGPPPSFRKKPTSFDKKTTTTNKPEKAGGTPVGPAAPSLKKTPTISDNKPTTSIQLTEAVPTKNDAAAGKTPTFPAPLPPQTEKSSRKPGPGEIDADAWEEAEMARIRQRYQKLIMVIENWKNKKKKKAENKLDRIQAELDKRRTRAMQSYHSDIIRIQDIAKGASANADKNRVNEENKVKNKANKIRSTGKLPVLYICC